MGMLSSKGGLTLGLVFLCNGELTAGVLFPGDK